MQPCWSGINVLDYDANSLFGGHPRWSTYTGDEVNDDADRADAIIRKGHHGMAALATAGAWLFGLAGVLILVWR